ncbi:hypothetical protein [Gordonia otitidis]|uniref:Uncharacterized protein n=1 Tax=Gordonia otitidis (strain DSM 44809 / CCUG 52243 / JCM 12355 / NBRC 100426 / IFM 10032) TaxID=1108044 RepID=H5TSK5_GORO1|nr:hypothetical protein [Gordonia otitidis]GAB36463.1 hypothetical protein GOOTI_221_00060 [Gordonia otitidis NBRC 100426]
MAFHHSTTHVGHPRSHQSGVMDTLIHGAAWRAGTRTVDSLFQWAPTLAIAAVICAVFIYCLSRYRRRR